MKPATTLLALVALLVPARLARAQDDNPFQPPFLRQEDPRERLKELFRQVETRLGEIDRLLYRAGSGDAPLGKAEESGIARLLEESRASGKRVLEDIDEILDIAQQMGGGSVGQSMQGGQQPGGQQGSQGQPQQGSQRPQSQERTPDAPGEPQGQGQEQGRQQPSNQPGQKDDPSETQGGDPKGSKESKANPANESGGPPPKSASGSGDGARSNEQWGDLPPTVRDLFRTEGGGDLPPQYRDWIDAYYRRLNKERR